MQRAALDQHRADRAAAPVELGLDHHAFGGAVRIGLELEHLGLQRDRLEQLVEAGLLERRDLHLQRVAAELSTTISWLSSSVRTCCGSAPGLSILLIATIIGTPAALA